MADDTQVSVGGREFTLTHPDKVLRDALDDLERGPSQRAG
jgi:hypothetical protein